MDNLVLDEERKYKELCYRLMQRYLHRTLGLSPRDLKVIHVHEQKHNERDAFLNKVDQYLDHWKLSCQRDENTIL